jgi:hypothetical protein
MLTDFSPKKKKKEKKNTYIWGANRAKTAMEVITKCLVLSFCVIVLVGEMTRGGKFIFS